MAKKSDELTDNQKKFVNELAKGKKNIDAAKATGSKDPVGYAKRYISDPRVKKGLAAIRSELRSENSYGVSEAVAEIDANMELAIKARQFGAVAKFNELKLKVHGLIDKDPLKNLASNGFQIVINGLPLKQPPIEVESTPIEVESTPIEVESTPIEVESTPIEAESTPIESESAPMLAVESADDIFS